MLHKKFGVKDQKNNNLSSLGARLFAECRHVALGKEPDTWRSSGPQALPSVTWLALSKDGLFTECRPLALGKDPPTWHSSGPQALSSVTWLPIDKEPPLCRVPGGRYSAKQTDVDVIWSSILCRVQVFAKRLTLGKEVPLSSVCLCRVSDTR
jgi:hypothetical protein